MGAMAAFACYPVAWGWPKFAALCGLGFGAMLRPSEFLRATRGLLVLPADVQGPWFRCFLRIPSPKTKWSGATRQLARCDEWWVTALLIKEFGEVGNLYITEN